MTPTTRSLFRATLMAAMLAGAVSSLTGCIPLLFGGAAAGTATVMTDRRTSGVQLDDQTMAFKAESDISKQLGGGNTRINATAYNGQLLLTGDVPTEAAKNQATAIARQVNKVRSVINQLNVGPVPPPGERNTDVWLGAKVRTTLLNAAYVPSGAITSTTDRGVVYLMGKVTQEEGNYAALAVSGVSGIVKVVKLFEYISRDEALRLSGKSANSAPDNGSAPASSPAPVDNTDTGETGGGSSSDTMQTMPIR